MLDANTMSLQEIFEAAVTHIFNQGERSVAPYSGRCLYRGTGTKEGLKCAAGIFLSDEQAAKSDAAENSSWGAICRVFYPGLDSYKVLLIGRLQNLHDDLRGWYDTNSMKNAIMEYVMCDDEFASLDTRFMEKLSFKDK